MTNKELLEEYRSLTDKMTTEKLEYLRKRIIILNPIINFRLSKIKSSGPEWDELADRYEYYNLFQIYENRWYSQWKHSNWGNKEDESLSDYADSALSQAVEKEKEKERNCEGR